jgi:hypothetical protein
MKVKHTRNYTDRIKQIQEGIAGYTTVVSDVVITIETCKFINNDESNGLTFTFLFGNKIGYTMIPRASIELALTRSRPSLDVLYQAIARCIHMDCITGKCF